MSQSASSLLGLSVNKITPNVPNTDDTKIYNPSIPVKNDINLKSVKDIKFKDRYYVDNSINGQMRNIEGLSLGQNNKYLKRFDYDNAISENYIRRLNVSNKKLTLPNDFYYGSTDAYYAIPPHIKSPTITSSLPGAQIAMNQYQYMNRFTNATPESTSTINKTPIKTKPTVIKPAVIPTENNNSIGLDTNYQKMMDDIKAQQEQDKFDASLTAIREKPTNEYKDKYGNTPIRAGSGIYKPFVPLGGKAKVPGVF